MTDQTTSISLDEQIAWLASAVAVDEEENDMIAQQTLPFSRAILASLEAHKAMTEDVNETYQAAIAAGYDAGRRQAGGPMPRETRADE